MVKTYIYALVEANGEVRYVGKSDTPEKRFAQHLGDQRGERVCRWMQARVCENRIPRWGVLEVCEAEDEEALELVWTEAESRWIAYFRSIGADLLNHTAGGMGRKGSYWTEGQRKAHSALLKKKQPFKGRKHSEESKRRISETKRLRAEERQAAARRQRIDVEGTEEIKPIDVTAFLESNEAALKRRRTEEKIALELTSGEREIRPETRRKMSVAKIIAWARRVRDEECEAYAAWDGYIAPPKPPRPPFHHSEETKELIRQARARQIIPAEAYARNAEKRRGVPLSPERRAKISQKAKERVKRDGPPVSWQPPESRRKQSETMKENWQNGVFKSRRELTPEEREWANEKRKKTMKGHFYGDREKAVEGIRRDGLIRAYRNDLAEIETLSPEALLAPAVKYWYAEASQTKRFLSREDFAAYHDEKEALAQT